ncbi:Enterobactin exporter EntS [Rubrobacter xylanophilus DSM 9941]|uniref:MFS transporter n=1 Tax=Rubrobacter xylanophilus TaxID=49319 RepID=UPI001C6404D3|nr:MFS transporter [Rubrobacter xylanophilus]QYJ14533.1 Enterobactin exporter EntS [Rubrobacter xylanophilus DSM 9941]
MLLRSPGFLRVYCSQLLSLLGDQLYLIALPWVVLELTGSALALGTVFALGAFPRALLFPVGGALADRVEASRLMVASGFARGLVIAGLAALLGTGQTWAPYLVAVLLGAAASFYYPAEGSLLPRLLPRDLLQSANGLVQGTNQLASVLGPALGGAVVGALGGGAALTIAAGTYTLAAVVMLGVRVRRGRVRGTCGLPFPAICGKVWVLPGGIR